jgi:hypothetical protein
MRIGRHFRRARFRKVLGLLRQVLSHKDRVSVLDIGGEAHYWALLPDDVAARCDLHLVNLDAPKLEGGEHPKLSVQRIIGDGCDLSRFGDRSFDVAHSNSVIEHVGEFDRMRQFASEMRRVGAAVYVQTPYLWFPVEPHYGALFVHWFAAMHRRRIQSERGLGIYRRPSGEKMDYEEAVRFVATCTLLDRACFDYLFPDCEAHHERLGPFIKSLVGVRPYGSGR